MKCTINSSISTAILIVFICLFSSLNLSGCKDDDDNEDKILEQRDDYKKFIDHKLKGTKGILKDAKGWVFNSPVYGWIVTFGDIYSENYDKTQLPVIEANDIYYRLSGSSEMYSKFKDQYVLIDGKYTYLYTIDHLDIDYWIRTAFFEIDYTDITPYED